MLVVGGSVSLGVPGAAHAAENVASTPVSLSGPSSGGFQRLMAAQTGVRFSNSLSVTNAALNQIRLNGSGVAAGDVNGDGWCDLYFCGLDGSNALYLNRGNWRFEDATDAAGVACSGQFSTGAVLVDVDGDGDLDLLVNALGGGTRLFLNTGAGRFDESTSSGLSRSFGAMSMALADVDGDGLLDLYVANYRTTTIRSTGFNVLNNNGRRSILPEDRDHLEYTPEGRVLEHGEPDILYRNRGQGRFEPVSWTGGVFLDENGKALPRAPRDWGQAVLFRDLNGDGFPDLYVCNDFQSPDRIWINDGTGRFRALATQALRNTSTFSMAIDVGDLNRDGADDFFVADMLDRGHALRMRRSAGILSAVGDYETASNRPQVGRNTLQMGRGDGTFAELAYFAGLESSGWTWSAVLLDVDLDGYEDLLLTTGHLFDTQDLDANERIQAKGPYRKDQIPWKLLQYPPRPQPKSAYRNLGGMRFEEVGKAWGFGDEGIAHGMCVADLDNDGDLDVVVNELNHEAGVYRNEAGGGRVGVRLKGEGGNTHGIGARVTLVGGAVGEQSQEMQSGGRYLSGDDAMRVFATGGAVKGMRLEVAWRSGKRSVVEGVEANRVYEVKESGAVSGAKRTEAVRASALFSDQSALLGHVHRETYFDDFERQALLPRKLSQLGPGVGWMDLDGDGNEDLVIGSGKGGAMAGYVGDGKGGLRKLEGMPLGQMSGRDQSGIVGWKREDGVVEVLVGMANYEDGVVGGSSVRRYDLGGRVVEDALAAWEGSAGPLALGVLGEGTVRLFVGGRVMGGKYPESGGSRLYVNRGKGWVKDETNEGVLKAMGMVSGAVWTDLDGDGTAELVVASEWGTVRVYRSDGETLKEATKVWGLEKYVGWWNGVNAGDFNGDGRMDLVVSNWGRNSGYRASAEAPRRLYVGDVGGGSPSLMEAWKEGNKWVPEVDRDALSKEWPWVQGKYPTHRGYGEASVEEIVGDAMGKVRLLEANWLETTVFLNRGGKMEVGRLPEEAQWSPAFGVSIGDFDGDGNEDVFLGQNFFGVPARTSRSDAGRGLVLKGDGKGGFRALSGDESGVKMYGEQRGSAVGDFDGDGRLDLVVGQNSGETKLYRNQTGRAGLRVRLKGPAKNGDGVGAVLRRWSEKEEERGAAKEVHSGSGYWSEDGRVVVMGGEVKVVGVRWPGSGKEVVSEIPGGAKEVVVDRAGNVTVNR